MGDGPHGIFISYRRDDSADVTGRIYDHLTHAFGEELVFKDVDAIPLGVDFRQHLGSEMARCQVVLVVIGDGWVDARDGEGKVRLDDPADFVRLEVSAALERGIPVVPLLVQGATMPAADVLPEEIRELAFRHGTTIKRDPDFKADMQRLIRGLRVHFADSDGELPNPVTEEEEGRTEPSIDIDLDVTEESLEDVELEVEPFEVALRIYGTWYYRPADEPDAEWIGLSTPATVVIYPGEEAYRLRAGYNLDGEKLYEPWPDDEQLALLEDLQGFEALERLEIKGGEAITDAGLAYVGRLSSLAELDMTRCGKITDAGLSGLWGLKGLRELCLGYCENITDAGLAQLRVFESLARLDLSGCTWITDAGLGNLRGLGSLEELNLSGCDRVTDAGLAHLTRLRRLETLSLAWCTLNDAGLSRLAVMPALSTLELGFCSGLSGDGLRRLARVQGLANLDLRGAAWLDDDAMGYISWMTGLRRLGLAWCTSFTDGGLRNLVPLGKLEMLDLRGCDQLTDAAAKHIGEMRSLLRLNLTGCSGFSEKTIRELGSALPGCGIDV